jgi:outer membrane protein insertion porin family
MLSRVCVGRRAQRLLASALCALAVLAFARDGSIAAPAEVSPAGASIVVHGNRRVDAAAIREHFHASPEGRLDPAAVNAGLKTLYATGLFDDVKIAWSGPRLVVTVLEAPVVDRVQFVGNKQLKDKDLTKEIRSKAHTPLTKAAIQDDVARIA